MQKSADKYSQAKRPRWNEAKYLASEEGVSGTSHVSFVPTVDGFIFVRICAGGVPNRFGSINAFVNDVLVIHAQYVTNCNEWNFFAKKGDRIRIAFEGISSGGSYPAYGVVQVPVR